MLDVHPEQDGPCGRGDDHIGQQEDEQELLNLRFNVIDDPGRQLPAFRIGACDVNDTGARSVAEQQQKQDQEDNHDSFAATANNAVTARSTTLVPSSVPAVAGCVADDADLLPSSAAACCTAPALRPT